MRSPGSPAPSRRQLISGCAAAAACAGGVTACSGSSGSAQPTVAPSRKGSGATLAQLADVKVGKPIAAKTPAGKPIIIVQPKQGTVVAFSAICTHSGCTVAPSADGATLVCPCHGSTFDAATGKNTGGPAPVPLPKVLVEIKGDAIVAI